MLTAPGAAPSTTMISWANGYSERIAWAVNGSPLRTMIPNVTRGPGGHPALAGPASTSVRLRKVRFQLSTATRA